MSSIRSNWDESTQPIYGGSILDSTELQEAVANTATNLKAYFKPVDEYSDECNLPGETGRVVHGESLNQPLVIQLLGQARAGKDFSAEQLKLEFEQLNYSVEIKSYAQPVKRIASTLFDISLEQLDKYKNNSDRYKLNMVDYLSGNHHELGSTRTFLQRLGNEAIKPEFGNSVWSDLMKLQVANSSADIILIPDCRFITELAAFPQAVTVRVVNNQLSPPMDHPSELELLNYPTTYQLDNTNQRLTAQDITNLAQDILDDN